MQPSVPGSPDVEDAEDLLFDVYEAPRGGADDKPEQFGISRSEEGAVIVEPVGGALRLRRVSSMAGVQALSKRLRQGFRSVSGVRFFNPRADEFTLQHPDLCWKGARVVLVSRQGRNVAAAASAIAEIARSTSTACISGGEIDAWLLQQQRNAAHVVAFDDHPLWALALGELVFSKGWDWRPGPGLERPPSGRPSTDPHQWARWLQNSFSAHTVRDAQAALTWTQEAISIHRGTLAAASGLSSLL